MPDEEEGGFKSVCENTEGIRGGIELAAKLTGDEDAEGVLGVVNGGMDVAKDLDDGEYLDAAIDGAGVVSSGAGLLGFDRFSSSAGAVAGAATFGKGVGEIATSEEYSDETWEGIHDVLTGGADATSGFFGKNNPIGKVAGAFSTGMEIGDAIAPLVYGDMNEKGSHMEDVPEGGFSASTGNSAVDWLFGVN